MDKKLIEAQIRELLKLELKGTTLSNLLFGQFGGLFGQLGSTQAERRKVSRTPLFREALDRVEELTRIQYKDVFEQADRINAALARAREKVQKNSSETSKTKHRGAKRQRSAARKSRA